MAGNWIPMALDVDDVACEVLYVMPALTLRSRFVCSEQAVKTEWTEQTNAQACLSCAQRAQSIFISFDRANTLFAPVFCLLERPGSDEHYLMAERFRVKRPKAVFLFGTSLVLQFLSNTDWILVVTCF